MESLFGSVFVFCFVRFFCIKVVFGQGFFVIFGMIVLFCQRVCFVAIKYCNNDLNDVRLEADDEVFFTGLNLICCISMSSQPGHTAVYWHFLLSA